ncbi:MAG: hypothetical protein HY961_21920 [Ignavibacteriae bacterium]|nr:hypothetical protein [Ignavibacteriota bacterium]
MYMSRDVFHCKPGKAKELVTRFKQFSEILGAMGYQQGRVFTDISGESYWTVVMEQDVEKIDDLAEMSRKVMSDPRTANVMKDYHDLVLDGRREIFRVE